MFSAISLPFSRSSILPAPSATLHPFPPSLYFVLPIFLLTTYRLVSALVIFTLSPLFPRQSISFLGAPLCELPSLCAAARTLSHPRFVAQPDRNTFPFILSAVKVLRLTCFASIQISSVVSRSPCPTYPSHVCRFALW